MKRLALILFLASQAFVCGATDVAGGLLKEAQADVATQKFDDALGLYEQVITLHPEAIDRWFVAQQGIVTTLAAKGDLAEAAKAAHVCMDAAPNLQSYDIAVVLAANVLSALDKSVDRANKLLAFQSAGPGGGTVNPMDAVGYPSLTAREQAFVTLRRQAGDNAMASRLRAFSFLYEGKPREALLQFADAFRRGSGSADLGRSGTDLVLVGLRAVRGCRAGLDKGIQFVIYGPYGPDNKQGGADDIADPFAELLSAVPAAGDGGLADFGEGELAALRQVRDAAQLYGGDSRLRPDMRRAALLALQRSNDALDAWGTKGQKEWYLGHALEFDDPMVSDLFFTGAQSAARGRSLHFGDVYALWNDTDAYVAAHSIKSRAPEAARRDFNAVIAALGKIQFQAPALKMLTVPASYELRSK